MKRFLSLFAILLTLSLMIAFVCPLNLYSAYAASKAAVESAVRTLSAELMRKNIYIFSIRAAFVASPMTLCLNAFTEGGFDQHLRETGKQPMGLLSTDHTSDFIHYLLSSPTAPYMTGTNIPIPAGTPC